MPELQQKLKEMGVDSLPTLNIGAYPESGKLDAGQGGAPWLFWGSVVVETAMYSP